MGRSHMAFSTIRQRTYISVANSMQSFLVTFENKNLYFLTRLLTRLNGLKSMGIGKYKLMPHPSAWKKSFLVENQK